MFLIRTVSTSPSERTGLTTPGGGVTTQQRGGYRTNVFEGDQSFVKMTNADVIIEHGCTTIKTDVRTVPGEEMLRGGMRDDRGKFISTSTIHTRAI